MKIDAKSNLADVAETVAAALDKANIRAVLTGGACATIHTRGQYQSEDLDFLLQSAPAQAELDAAMATIGFQRRGAQFFHRKTAVFVEFPAGPLGIGRDIEVRPVPVRVRRGGPAILALSATDSCRDRLAAFYHWGDRQSLDVAVAIALRNRIDMKKIRDWSAREGQSERFAQFLRELALARRSNRGARGAS